MSENLETWETKLLDNENQPEFYDVLEVLSLKDNIDRLTKIVVAITIVVNFLRIYPFQSLLIGNIVTINDLEGMIVPISITIIRTTIDIVMIYFPLKALSHILRILMEMEFNSRNAK